MARKKHKYHFIYRTTCIINGKFYIGMHSTSNLDDSYMGSGDRVKNSIRYHGKKNHKIEILEFLDDRISLKDREKEIINEEFLKDPMCMNIALGGEGGLFSKEHAKKFHAAGGKKVWQIFSKIHQSKMKEDLEYKERFCESIRKSWENGQKGFGGKSHSDSTKKKMSVEASKRTGNKNSQFGSRWITNGTLNKKIKKDSEIPKGWYFGRI